MRQHRAEPGPISPFARWVPGLAALARDDSFGFGESGEHQNAQTTLGILLEKPRSRLKRVDDAEPLQVPHNRHVQGHALISDQEPRGGKGRGRGRYPHQFAIQIPALETAGI
jgi:hypothetical protein